MSDASRDSDAEYVRTAYADKVKEAFIVFADNLATGQPEKACRERFLRALDLVRKARDLALAALSDPQAQSGEGEAAAARNEPVAEALSAEDQALVDSVLAGTTGVHRPAPPPTRFSKP